MEARHNKKKRHQCNYSREQGMVTLKKGEKKWCNNSFPVPGLVISKSKKGSNAEIGFLKSKNSVLLLMGHENNQ